MINARGFLVIILAALVLIAFGMNVKAHDSPDNWIGQERRTNAEGVLCCGTGDCKAIPASEIRTRPDGYHFPSGEVIPFQKAAPSVDRSFWICRWGTPVETKCVFAPIGGT